MVTNNYTILRSHVARDFNFIDWQNSIIKFLNNYLDNKKISLFEFEPTKHSLIYEYDTFKKININSKDGMYINGISLSKDEIKALVLEADFYLGNLVIVISEISNPLDIFYSWDNLFESECEIISQKSDGLYFYIYNPTDETSKLFNKFFNV